MRFTKASVFRFLYADPTRSALQVLSRSASLATDQVDALSTDANTEDGVWINADPIDGCVVVNIGESARPSHLIFRIS